MEIYKIIEELNLENGSNYKLAVLEKYKDHEVLMRLLKMAYDKVQFTYGITMKNVNPGIARNTRNLEYGLLQLEKLADRTYTGNAAIAFLEEVIESMSEENAEIIKKVIDRDLRINLGRKQINKVFKKLITEFPYMRCSLPAKHLKNIKYPAIVQEKLDGTYRSVIVENSKVSIYSRSGEESYLPKFAKEMSQLDDGIYIGELLVADESNRFKANGLINSDEEPDSVYMVSWDYLNLEEWKEGKSNIDYIERFRTLEEKVDNVLPIYVAKYRIVDSYDEAKEFYKDIVSKGGEGSVLKNLKNKFKNGTANDIIKMKEEAVAEFIITGFAEGEGRLKGTLGAIEVKSQDEHVISSVSGYSDKMRDEIWTKREALLGTIISVKYNGVSKAKGNDHYSLMFAVFDDLRPDKDVADNLEYIQEALK